MSIARYVYKQDQLKLIFYPKGLLQMMANQLVYEGFTPFLPQEEGDLASKKTTFLVIGYRLIMFNGIGSFVRLFMLLLEAVFTVQFRCQPTYRGACLVCVLRSANYGDFPKNTVHAAPVRQNQ